MSDPTPTHPNPAAAWQALSARQRDAVTARWVLGWKPSPIPVYEWITPEGIYKNSIRAYTDPASGAMWEVWRTVREWNDPRIQTFIEMAETLVTGTGWSSWAAWWFFTCSNPADKLCLCAAVACGWKREMPNGDATDPQEPRQPVEAASEAPHAQETPTEAILPIITALEAAARDSWRHIERKALLKACAALREWAPIVAAARRLARTRRRREGKGLSPAEQFAYHDLLALCPEEEETS